jgi:hypothetical protein
MKWFREAKFGLFIHWGLYCIPAGEWKGQPAHRGPLAQGERRGHLRRWSYAVRGQIGRARRQPAGQERQAGVYPGNGWRCTTKPGKLFIHFFKWPAGPFELSKVKGKVTKAYLLADARHPALKMSQSGDKVTVSLPATAPGQIASVMVLETAN